jgi:hypothetical protein
MQTTTKTTPDYSNWVSKKFIYIPWVMCLVLIGLSFWAPVFYLLAALFLLITLYFDYIYTLWWVKLASCMG